jgi:hypothetical protein
LSYVHWLEGATDEKSWGAQYSAWQRLVSPSPTVKEMVMQCPGWCWRWRGWPHRTDGDGGDWPRRPSFTALSLCGGSIVARLPFEGSTVLFRGCGELAVWEWVAQCHRVVARPCRTTSHSGGDGLTGGVGRAVPGRDSQARRGMGSSLTWAPANVSALNPPIGGPGMEAVDP